MNTYFRHIYLDSHGIEKSLTLFIDIKYYSNSRLILWLFE